jgi:hypothetical protein
MIGYSQHGTETGCAGLQPTQRPSREARRSLGSSVQRQTAVRNGGPSCRSPTGSPELEAGVNWIRHGGGIAQEARAFEVIGIGQGFRLWLAARKRQLVPPLRADVLDAVRRSGHIPTSNLKFLCIFQPTCEWWRI